MSRDDLTPEELNELESAIADQESPYVNVDIDDYRRLIAMARRTAELEEKMKRVLGYLEEETRKFFVEHGVIPQ